MLATFKIVNVARAAQSETRGLNPNSEAISGLNKALETPFFSLRAGQTYLFEVRLSEGQVFTCQTPSHGTAYAIRLNQTSNVTGSTFRTRNGICSFRERRPRCPSAGGPAGEDLAGAGDTKAKQREGRRSGLGRLRPVLQVESAAQHRQNEGAARDMAVRIQHVRYCAQYL